MPSPIDMQVLTTAGCAPITVLAPECEAESNDGL
jgi:hypothetical protein